MTRTPSTLRNIILIAAFALLPFAAVNASAQNSAHVNVPFAFVANHTLVPAGYYQVLSSETTLTLINAGTGRAQAVLLARHEAGDAIETQGRLLFRVSGNRHVLTQVQFAGSSVHSRLLAQPKPERTVSRTTNPTTLEIAMR